MNRIYHYFFPIKHRIGENYTLAKTTKSPWIIEQLANHNLEEYKRTYKNLWVDNALIPLPLQEIYDYVYTEYKNLNKALINNPYTPEHIKEFLIVRLYLLQCQNQ